MSKSIKKNPRGMIITPTYRGYDPNQAHLSTVFHQAVRNMANMFGVPTSGLSRTVQRNKEVGGVVNSRHLYRNGTGWDGSLQGNWQAMRKLAESMGIRTLVHDAGSGMHLHLELPAYISPKLAKNLSKMAGLAGTGAAIDVASFTRTNNTKNTRVAAAVAPRAPSPSPTKGRKGQSQGQGHNAVKERSNVYTPEVIASVSKRKDISPKKASTFLIGDNDSISGMKGKNTSLQFSGERLTPDEALEKVKKFAVSGANKNSKIILDTGIEHDANGFSSAVAQIDILYKAGYKNVEVRDLPASIASSPRGVELSNKLKQVVQANGFSMEGSGGNQPVYSYNNGSNGLAVKDLNINRVQEHQNDSGFIIASNLAQTSATRQADALLRQTSSVNENTLS